jgi:pimeloyl-ACP methyl ester carboxylesterase
MSATASVPVRALSKLIDALLAQYSLTDEALIIYGFSQGGMVATYLGITRPNVCAGVVNHSGQFWGAVEVNSRPRTLLLLGELELQPFEAMLRVFPITKAEIEKTGIELHTRKCKG